MQDWNQRAKQFSVWLPHLQAATGVLLEALKTRKPLSKGSILLDLATGTGEPAGTLHEQFPECTVIAVDNAVNMLHMARHRLQASPAGLYLAAMSGQALALLENQVDVCVSRFGIMLFDSVDQGLEEIARILKPRGGLFFTVWSDPERMPSMKWCHDAFAGKIPDDAMPHLAKATAMGNRKATQSTLQSCGFDQIEITEHELEFVFPDFSAYWECVIHSGIMQPQFEQLPPAQHDGIRQQIESMAQPFIKQGRLQIPHAYLCIRATKAVV